MVTGPAKSCHGNAVGASGYPEGGMKGKEGWGNQDESFSFKYKRNYFRYYLLHHLISMADHHELLIHPAITDDNERISFIVSVAQISPPS
jgi:hypothetical protein